MFRAITAATVVMVLIVGVQAAAEQSMSAYAGTWKMNPAKSKYSPTPGARSITTKLEIVDGSMRITSDIVDGQGKAYRSIRTAVFDGKEHRAEGTPNPTAYTYRWVDDHHFEWVQKVTNAAGLVGMATTKVALSADGKTQTLTTDGRTADEQAVHNVVVFERQ